MNETGGLPGLSVRRPILAAVTNILIVIGGIAAIFGVEVRELPDIDRPIVSVRASYPGASPTTLDAEATSVVEAAVARVAGVVTVNSASEEGNFRVRAEFRPDVDLAVAANDVREAVSRVVPHLPAGVEDLFVVKAEQDARPIMQVVVWSERDPIDELTRRVEDEVIPELTAVDGVADVSVFGERERVIRVAVEPEKLAAFGLSIGEVASVLRAAQFDVPVGSFSAGEMEVMVRADATVAEPARIAELMIRDPVRLGDLADVYFGLATPVSVARLNNRLVLSLGIVRQAQSNTVAISEQVQKVIGRLETRFPDLRFEVTSDDAVFIRGAIKEVLSSLVIALVIVVLVLWLFLGRLGVTMVPAIAIPVSLIGSIAAIWALGFSINLITLLALVLATGLVVDDAIVVTENIQRRRAEGMGPMAAAVLGTRQVFFAVGRDDDHADRRLRADLVHAERRRAAVRRVRLRAGDHRRALRLRRALGLPDGRRAAALDGQRRRRDRVDRRPDRRGIRGGAPPDAGRAAGYRDGGGAGRLDGLRRPRPARRGARPRRGPRDGHGLPAGAGRDGAGLYRPPGRRGRGNALAAGRVGQRRGALLRLGPLGPQRGLGRRAADPVGSARPLAGRDRSRASPEDREPPRRPGAHLGGQQPGAEGRVGWSARDRIDRPGLSRHRRGPPRCSPAGWRSCPACRTCG